MALSNELISQFVKITKDDSKQKTDPMVYGTIVEYEGSKYIKIDGSDLLTPITPTAKVENDERVTAVIKDHQVIVTGNITSPSATEADIDRIGTAISEFEIVVAGKVDTIEFNAEKARIDDLQTDNVTIKETLTANAADIRQLEADNVTINENLLARKADIDDLIAENVEITNKLNAADADIKSVQADNVLIRETLNANNADISDLKADNVTVTEELTAVKAKVDDMDVNSLTVTEADLRYANIDFTNISEAAIEYFYATSGLIENVTISEGTITGNLVGVTIKGDIIEGGTVIADKLVIKGDDGLYYKLNTDGVTTETEQTEYNSLNGSVITAKSITATKISVDDLVAFDATIGGFHITDNSLYSGAKESVDNTTRGVYMDSDGQMAFGDQDNYVKFYRDTDGTYKLAISAGSMMFSGTGKDVETAIEEVGDSVVSVSEEASDAANTNATAINDALLVIDSLKATLSTLITGQNGESLMTQTDTGWSFSMKNIMDSLNDSTESIDSLNSSMADVNTQINTLNSITEDLAEYTEYIEFGTYAGAPCILLGEHDSPFKLRITNTSIQFEEGSTVPAYINGGSMYINKAVIEEELQQGKFAWVARANGNYGLVWKG